MKSTPIWRTPIRVDWASSISAASLSLENPKLLWGLVATLLVIAPFLYAHVNRLCTNPDPYVYGQAAKQVLEGNKLYSEAWQDKPTLGILIYALPQLVVPRSVEAIGFFLGMILALQVGMFAYVFRGEPRTILLICIFIILMPCVYMDYWWPSTEHFSNPSITVNLLVAYVIFRDKRVRWTHCVLAGLATTTAFFFRQNTLLSGLMPLLAMFWTTQSFLSFVRNLGIWIAAGAIGTAAIVALTAWLGDLDVFWYTVVTYPQYYASAGDYEQLWELLANFWRMTNLIPLGFLCLILLLRSEYRLAAFTSFAIGLLLCVLPMRKFQHYMVNLFPFISFLLALVVTHCRLPKGAVTLAWVMMLLSFGPGAIWILRVAHLTRYPEEVAATVEEAEKWAPADGRMWAVGRITSEHFHFASHLKTNHPIYSTFQMTPPWINMIPWRLKEIRKGYFQNPPDVILVDDLWFQLQKNKINPNIPFKMLSDLLDEVGYQRRGQVGDYVVYVRKNKNEPEDSWFK